MKLSMLVKAWLCENADVKADASDEEFRKALGEALAKSAEEKGSLSLDKLAELNKEPEGDDEVKGFGQKLDAVVGGIEALTNAMTEKLEGEKKPEGEKEKKPEGEKFQEPDWHKSMKRIAGMSVPVDESTGQPRVKGAWEKYSTTKSALHYPETTKKGEAHPRAGQRVMDFAEAGKAMDSASDLDKAVCGSFAKFLCSTKQRGGSKSFGFQALPQEDKELLVYAMKEMNWGGATDGGDFADIKNRKLSDFESKALIDDAVSGGLEAAPIVFDDMVIQTPLLHGELFPKVRIVPLDRGRRIEGVVTGTVTGSWGGVDDSAISLFNTAAYVSAFDTTIYRWEGAIRIGLDFLSDSPIDFGSHITEQYGERMLEDLDDVVSVGNGTTQPEGVMNKTGTTSVAFGGANSISNIESLRYGVAKAEHRSTVAASACFCGNETTYQRWRALPVGAADARRLFGLDHLGPGAGGYAISNAHFAVNESMANTQAFYAILGRYRMYRRRGLYMRTSTEGDTLIRNNEMLMVAMMRYGGQLERGAVAAVSTTLPA